MKQHGFLVVVAVFCAHSVSGNPVRHNHQNQNLRNDDPYQSCYSKVYCQGDLLDLVQRARLFNDSKSFVDMSQVNSYETTISNFDQLMRDTNNNPSKDQVKKFVEENFESENELEDWVPQDYNPEPVFLSTIQDPTVKEFAKDVVNIWPALARKVKSDVLENPDKHSLISVPNGFIVPGGRFKEIYYWDSFWIVKGLLISDMSETVKGMLENLLSLIDRFGFIPNGSRVYYLNRSQPPLLTAMVGMYLNKTGNIDWLRENIGTLEKELTYWLNNKTTIVEKDGVKYEMAHYISKSNTPRPESYYEDVSTCAGFETQDEINSCYNQLKNGAETGWDFSTRWIFDKSGGTNSNLTHIEANRVAPVDLNSYLCQAFALLAKFYTQLGDTENAIRWQEKAESWKKTIRLVLYDKDDGIWYDYDIELKKPRKIFFPSNFAPLWADAVDVGTKKEFGKRAAAYLKSQGIESYQGGIPTSISQSGEQWDLPNAWPPLQDIVVTGLKNSGDEDALELAETFAKRWIDANMIGFSDSKEMYEKYDAIHSGQYGGGGEYKVQAGFGWTNGVVLGFIQEFYTDTNKIHRL